MAGITSTKKIKGQPHLLAYITPNEVEKLKALGGQETMTKEGIPAYPESDYYGVSQDDFAKGNFKNSTEKAVKNLATGKTGVSADELARRNMKEKIEAGFTGQSKVNPTFFEIGGKKDRFNKRKRQKFINYLINEKKKNLQKGLMDPSIPGVDVMTMEEMIGFAPSVKDLVNKGVFKADGPYAKGEKIPSYNINPEMPGLLNFAAEKFGAPVTSDKLQDYYSQITELQNLDSKDSKNSIQNLIETYQPNRLNFINQNKGNPYILPQYAMMGGGADTGKEDATEETTFDYRFGTGQNVGADVLRGYVANGGRITRAGGGIMNAVPRQGYFLGKIVKGVGKAIGSVADAAGKVLKSDLGKAALLYAGGVYLGGGNLFSASAYNPANFLGKKGYLANIAGKALLKDPTKGFGVKDNLSMMKMLGLSAALPFIPGINKAPENEDIGMTDRGGRLIDPLTGEEGTPASMRANIENAKIEAGGDPIKLAALNQKYNNMLFTNLPYENYGLYANGGRIARAEGGLMNLGGMEKDYRAEGGFVPIGKAEKADDVPARLSVNEFVFTADAVRNAGGGDIDKGAEVMENMMKNLENGGRVSEESQGNTGAQEMFSVSERIGEVI